MVESVWTEYGNLVLKNFTVAVELMDAVVRAIDVVQATGTDVFGALSALSELYRELRDTKPPSGPAGAGRTSHREAMEQVLVKNMSSAPFIITCIVSGCVTFHEIQSVLDDATAHLTGAAAQTLATNIARAAATTPHERAVLHATTEGELSMAVSRFFGRGGAPTNMLTRESLQARVGDNSVAPCLRRILLAMCFHFKVHEADAERELGRLDRIIPPHRTRLLADNAIATIQVNSAWHAIEKFRDAEREAGAVVVDDDAAGDAADGGVAAAAVVVDDDDDDQLASDEDEAEEEEEDEVGEVEDEADNEAKAKELATFINMWMRELNKSKDQPTAKRAKQSNNCEGCAQAENHHKHKDKHGQALPMVKCTTATCTNFTFAHCSNVAVICGVSAWTCAACEGRAAVGVRGMLM